MSETNALAGASDPVSSSEQTQNAPSSTEQTQTTQPETEATEGQQPDAAKEQEPSQEGGEPQPEGKKPSRSAERISQLVRERNEAEIRAFAAEQEIKRLKRPLPAKDNMSETERMAREMREADRSERLAETEETANAAREEARSARFTLFSEKVGDPAIVDAFCHLPRVSEELADLVAESDHAKALAARLNANPSEARRLSNLPPHRLGAELARMEAQLATQPTVRRVSQAPEPGTSLKGGSSPLAKTPDKMNYTEYRKWREKQEARQ
jgi:hypothetical protein